MEMDQDILLSPAVQIAGILKAVAWADLPKPVAPVRQVPPTHRTGYAAPANPVNMRNWAAFDKAA